MIPVEKLAKLSPRHRMRKAALVLGELERGLLRGGVDLEAAAAYARRLGALVGEDASLERGFGPAAAPPGAAAPLGVAAPPGSAAVEAAAGALSRSSAEGGALLRAVDALRHALLTATGQAPADWDLLDPRTGMPDPARRRVRRGLRVYLEDLRSPFNIGAIFRTADAFGVEELLLSPLAADPRHPRAARSAMGAVDMVPWRRGSLEELAAWGPLFALELGGTPAGDFAFPAEGTVVVGSEELGVSPEALRLCSLGKVSIPMAGAKGSLNAAVAFGILLYAWTSSL
ncbi:MAG TPA: TrmH family RNA methyltransferase [Rectinemataceae bacterium]|nr:TrmH family RNA methyltransferase [Rectinemataceae bacterium]